MNCKHCGEIVSGKFCSECGQNIKVGKITFGSLLNELSENVFQVNKGFFYTLKEMFLRPGLFIRNYLTGKRKDHFKPIAYVLILSTLYLLITKITGLETGLSSFFSGWSEHGTGDNSENTMPKALQWAANNYAYFTLLSIPFFSYFTYIFFVKETANYIEHIILNAYITGQQAFMYSLLTILNYYCDITFLQVVPFLISIVFNIFVFNKFFDNSHWFKNSIRLIFGYIIYFIFFLIASLIIVGLSTSKGINIQY